MQKTESLMKISFIFNQCQLACEALQDNIKTIQNSKFKIQNLEFPLGPAKKMNKNVNQLRRIF
jgi:hypothetical protein